MTAQLVKPNPQGPDIAVAVSGASVALPALHSDTWKILVSVDNGPVRVTFDGSTPTINHGHYFPAGGGAVLWPRELYTKARFIRATAADAVLRITQLL